MEKIKLERINLSKYLKTKYKDIKDVDPADVDDVATAKDIASADKNIMIQLKKQIGLGNSFKVEFGDKKTARVPDKIAKAAIALYDKHKTSQQKGDYQNTISKSYKDLLSFIRKGKPVSMESKELKQMNPTDHVKEKDGKFCVYNADGSIAKEFDNKEDAEKYAIANHDKLMAKEEVTEAYLDRVLPKLSFDSTSEFKKAVKYFESQGLSQGYRGNEMEPAFDFNKFKDEITIYNLDELSPRINSKRGVDSFLKKGKFKYELNYIRNEEVDMGEEHLDERSKISDVVAKTGAERLAIVKKHYPFIADITDKRKKDKTVQGFFHFLKNKDKKAVDKLDKIIKKLGTKKGIAYIDSYRQNYLRMSNSEEENYIVEDNVATLKNIVKRKQAMPLKFKDGTMKIDLQTASGLVRSILGGKMKPETMKKLSQIINKGNKSQFLRLVDLMYK